MIVCVSFGKTFTSSKEIKGNFYLTLKLTYIFTILTQRVGKIVNWYRLTVIHIK